jgi:predicted phage tail protein
MTTINIYGKLSKKFGSQIKLHLGRINDFINAIDSVKNGFRQELINLHKNGLDYFYDFKKNEINIFPVFCGSGRGIGTIILAVVLIAIIVVAAVMTAGAILAAAPGAAGAGAGATAGAAAAGAAGAAATGTGITAASILTGAGIGAAFGVSTGLGLASVAIALSFNAAVSLLFAGIQMSLAKDPKQQDPQHIAVGGNTANISDQTKSYIFNNYGNQATQGSAIPIGYGRFKLGSKILAVSVRNYSTNQTAKNEFEINSLTLPNIYD